MKNWILILGLFCCQLGKAQIALSHEVYEMIELAKNKDVVWKNQSLEQEKLDLERKSVLNKYIPKVEAMGLYGYLDSKGSLDLPTKDIPLLGWQLFGDSKDFSFQGKAFHANVMAKAVLFSGGQIYNGAKALQYKNEGTHYMMALREDELIVDLIQSLDQLELLREAALLIDDSDKRLQKETERVEKAIEAGLAIPYDRDKIKLAHLELASKREDLSNKKELLLLKIQLLTGMEASEIVAINHRIEPIFLDTNLDVSQRNELKALESFQRAATYNIKKEKGSFLPTLGAFGGYSYSSMYHSEFSAPFSALNTALTARVNQFTLQPSWMVGVAMKWEIFSGMERSHKLEEAQLSKLQIDNQLNDTKEKLDIQLKKNQMEYQSQLHQLEIAKQREIIAQNNNTLAEKQYRAGLIGITERLSAENDLYKESLNKIETLIKQRQAAIEAYQSAGSLRSFITIR